MNTKRQNFVTIVMVLLSLFIAIAFAGCTGQPSIVGKWHQVASDNDVEFFRDGTFVWGAFSGKYAFVETNRIKLDFGLIGATCQVSLSEDTLTLVSEGGFDKGQVYQLRRVK
jgi:hypothetical protein